MDAPIFMPELVQQLGNMNTQKQVIADHASASFKAKALVYIASGVLIQVPTDGVLCYGQSPDQSHASTDIPPVALFGENHWVFDPVGAIFEINISSGTGAVTQANSAPQRSAVSIGSDYGILTPTSGTYSGFQFLATDETTATLFTVVGWVDGTAATDYNARVKVKIIPSKIQN